MTAAIALRDVVLPLSGLTVLEHEAISEGHGFLKRLRNDWTDAINRFDAPGECLLGAYQGADLVAIGGLNQDPYAGNGQTGRLRHIYVRRDHRRRGIARHVVLELLARNTRFTKIRLRTSNPDARRLYEHLGFNQVADPTATHTLSTP